MGLAGSGRDSDMAPRLWRMEKRTFYAFHPLAGRTVTSTGRRVVFGDEAHLTIRLADGTLTLTLEWMLRPAAAGCGIRAAPRLCLTRLRDLRVCLDAVLGSNDGESPPTDGADDAPEPPTARSIRNGRSSLMSDGTSMRRRTFGLDVVEGDFEADNGGGHAASLRRSRSAAQFHGRSSSSRCTG
jgi:hypothetical protein